MVYNTYKLKDEHFFISEKNLINENYSKSVRNDKVYPGAQRIIDRYFSQNMSILEDLYRKSPDRFTVFKDKMCDSIFKELRYSSNMDSLFLSIIRNNKLHSDLQYRLVIAAISVTFSNNHYIPLYQAGTYYGSMDSAIQTPAGIIIAGKLTRATKQNQVTFLNVSSPQDHTYQLSFGLYVDSPNRYRAILQLMKPTFALSLLSILAVVMIYFYTFKNWLKQKKIADMKSDFVNSISHEFHTPLATIIIANKNLQNEKVLEKKDNIRPLTNIIERQAQRLKTLFSSVLDITLMNESTLQKKQYFLNDLLDEVLLDYRLKLSDSNIEINFLRDVQNYKVILDRFWFTTMLLNIFENAIKYNNNIIKKIIVTTISKQGIIEIHISDNGIGMSSQTLQHIFEKFYRSNTNNSKEVGGIGLGLFYARQCIDAHKWQMQVNSKEGLGSEFIILIPVEK
ncbi:MAG: HAMP domain-containing sensor histidine kinase [Ferruginibacter sp.]